jgi:predicted phage terminase large subunit-like protein
MKLSIAEYLYVMRCDLSSFIHRSFLELNPQTKFLSNWHIDLLAAKLEAVMRGECRRLIVTLPPRNLKSHAVSVAFVAWYLGHYSSRQVICASYGQDLATKFARDCRTLMMGNLYKSIFRTRLSTRKAIDDFVTTDGGTRMATSVGGVLTGRGADLIVIDDALKPDDALSETKRTSVNDWYDNTLLSRLNNKEKGAIVIIMQRLHQDDLIGHVLEHGGAWDMVSFPAIADESEMHVIENALGRRTFVRPAGEALHPARESVGTLLRMREAMGEYNFASQYQQTPMPKGGAMVKLPWLQYYGPAALPKPFSTIVQSWDTANKISELNDYSVCTTWGYINSKFYLLDVLRKRLNYPDLKRAARDQKAKHTPNAIIVEDKASGTQLIQDLQADGLYNVKGIEHLPGTDKVMRLHSKTMLFENGAVFLPKQAPWLEEYVKELTGFPGTKFDDQVDSTTQALEYLQGAGRAVDVWYRAFGVKR